MEEREQGSSNIPELESPEAASAALNAAKSSTQEALKGNLQPEQRSFYEGVVENLEGAEAWLKERMPRRKFISSAIGITLAVSMLVSYAPNATGPVMASPGEGDNRATATESSPQVSSTTAPTETEIPTQPTLTQTEVPKEQIRSTEGVKGFMCGGFPGLEANGSAGLNTVGGLVGIAADCNAMGQSEGTLKFFSFGPGTKLPESIDVNKAQEINVDLDGSENKNVKVYDLEIYPTILQEWTDRQGNKTEHGIVMTIPDGFGAASGFGVAVPESGFLLITQDGAEDLLKDYKLFQITIK